LQENLRYDFYRKIRAEKFLGLGGVLTAEDAEDAEDAEGAEGAEI